jgi:hypothetical protein
MALQALPMIEPSTGFHDRLYERLAREELHHSPAPSRHLRWGMATAIVAASVALLFAASSRARHVEATRPAPVMAVMPTLPTTQRFVSGLAGRDVAASSVAAINAAKRTSAATASTAPRSRARFEALPGQGAAPNGPVLPQGAAIRLQTVNYIGQ